MDFPWWNFLSTGNCLQEPGIDGPWIHRLNQPFSFERADVDQAVASELVCRLSIFLVELQQPAHETFKKSRTREEVTVTIG